MEEPVDPVHDLLEEVASIQREQLRRAGVVAEVRGRVAGLPVRRASRLWFVLPAGVACAAGLAAVLWVGRPAPLAFSIGEPGNVGSAGSVLSARVDAELPVDFSDGSRVALAPGARVTVEAVASRGATLALEHGRAELRITHRQGTSWVVKAGPARVAVTGTRFFVAWDPATEVLAVEMREGSVVVSGAPGTTGDEVLHAGQTLRASRKLGRFEIAEASAPAAGAAEGPPSAFAPLAPPAEAPPAARTPGTQAPSSRPARLAGRNIETIVPPAAAESWRELAAETHYADALRAAEKAGFASACAKLGADDLVLLGDVARLAGDPDRAEQAYRTARRRFPTVDRSAFALGQTAFDQRRRYAEAAKWFETYLRQYPNGPLATEAAGRLLEAWDLAGETDRAREAARNYLRDHPTGSHRGLAQRLAGQ
jgi:transmembrane sensor